MTESVDPITDAISATADSAVGAEGLTLLILQKHLKDLCTLQLSNLSKVQVTLSPHFEDGGLLEDAICAHIKVSMPIGR